MNSKSVVSSSCIILAWIQKAFRIRKVNNNNNISWLSYKQFTTVQ